MSFQKETNYKNSSNQLLEKVFEGEKLLAIILRTSFKKEGIDFFTPPDFSQQLGYMNRPKGYKIQPHIHQKIERKIELTQEVLFIKKGLVWKVLETLLIYRSGYSPNNFSF